ncbi:extracellular solute-binding protein [Burkholderia cepacia]|uniref:extracellular solute-binding protein n=1 Tax=Burkholderia cepacia TaxID=292 RepID=UPI0029906287|nr:extracellular solute-binding protein [Burkholderia cepacia]MDW9247620.1 bacterial extracellular solute-binding family protein [Burkholderia cepacia]
MREIKQWINASSVAVLAALWMSPAVSAEKLIVTAFGGIWAESIEQNFGTCYKAKTGREIAIQLGSPAAWLNKMRANPSHPPIDVVTLPDIDVTRAIRAGMLDPLDASRLPSLKEIDPSHFDRWKQQAVDIHLGALGVLYNKSAIPNLPKDWRTLFDNIAAGKYGKRVSLPSGVYAWGPEFIWFVGQTYGGDSNLAFTKLKAMAPSVTKFWTEPTEALNLFATHQVDLVLYWDGRSHDFIDKGNAWAGYYNPSPKSLGTTVSVAKVKNGSDDAWSFINCALSARPQLAHATMLGYAVTNKTVIYPAALKARITPESDMIFMPYAEYVDQIPGWIDRWNREMR